MAAQLEVVEVVEEVVEVVELGAMVVELGATVFVGAPVPVGKGVEVVEFPDQGGLMFGAPLPVGKPVEVVELTDHGGVRVGRVVLLWVVELDNDVGETTAVVLERKLDPDNRPELPSHGQVVTLTVTTTVVTT